MASSEDTPSGTATEPQTDRPAESGNGDANPSTQAEGNLGDQQWQAWRSWGWHGSWYPYTWWGNDWSSGAYWQGSSQAAGVDQTSNSSQNGVVTDGARREPGQDPWAHGDPWDASRTAEPGASVGRVAGAAWGPSTWQTSWDWGSTWRSDRWSSDDWQWSQWRSKPDLSDPPSWPGWSHRRLWVQAVKRWDKLTDVPLHRRSEKILRSLGWELLADFEHLSEETLASAGYLDAIIEVMNSKAGVRDDDEKRRAYRQAITDTQRHRDETLAQFAVRRLRDFRQAAQYGVQIPDSLKAMLLREGAALSDQNQQNLMALLQGQEDNPDTVARVLGKMDVRSGRLVAYAEDAPTEGNYLAANSEDVLEDEETMDHEEIIGELEQLDLSEDQVCEVFAVLEHRRRTWKENKLLKADLRKDRGAFIKDGGPSFSRGQHGGPSGSAARGSQRSQLNREQLKKISKCRLCHKKGHWAEDCHLRKKPAAPSGFAYFGPENEATGSAFSFLSVKDLREVVDQVLGIEKRVDHWAFLSLPSGDCAILDIGATQDLIGSSSLEAMTASLQAVGLRPIKLDKVAQTPSGIGGMAKALGVVLLPISPGGVPGVLEMTVLEGSIPPLLSVGFLDFLGTTIDLEKNQIRFSTLGLELSMAKLPSGHRTISLVQWDGQPFPIPEEVSQKYDLAPGAFNLSQVDSCAYTKGEAAKSCNMLAGVPVQDLHYDEPNLSKPCHFVCDCSLSHELGGDVCAVTSAAEHSVACMINKFFGAGAQFSGRDLEESHVGHVSRHETRRLHDADPQHLRSENSRCPMGSRQSTTSQFAVLLESNGARFSIEPAEQRDECRGEIFSGGSALEQADASALLGVGGESPQVCVADQVGAAHEECSFHEAAASRGACGGTLLSSRRTGDYPSESVCKVEGVQSVPGACCLHVQASPLQSAPKPEGATDITSSGICNTDQCGRADGHPDIHTSCNQWGCGPGDSRGPAHLSASEHPVRSDDAAGGHFSAGVVPRPGADADADARATRCSGGAVVSGVRVRGPSKPQRPGNVRPWPQWMLASGALASSIFLSCAQCSAAFQQELQGFGFEEGEFYVFEYDLGGDPKLFLSCEVQEGSQECGGDLSGCNFGSADAKSSGSESCAEQGIGDFWPAWVPPFAQSRDITLTCCSELPESPSSDIDCCPLWRRVLDLNSGSVLENSPAPLCHLDFPTPMDLRVTYWGLPLDFVRLHSFATTDDPPLQLDHHGQPSISGNIWVVRSELLGATMDFEAENLSDVGSASDLRR